MRDTQIYPVSHQSDTFASSTLSDYNVLLWVSNIAKDPDKIAPLGSVLSRFIVIASMIMINYT